MLELSDQQILQSRLVHTIIFAMNSDRGTEIPQVLLRRFGKPTSIAAADGSITGLCTRGLLRFSTEFVTDDNYANIASLSFHQKLVSREATGSSTCAMGECR
jgi:hypothetical protein